MGLPSHQELPSVSEREGTMAGIAGDTQNDKISVAVPVLGAPEHLQASLDSLLTQSLRPSQIIVCTSLTAADLRFFCAQTVLSQVTIRQCAPGSTRARLLNTAIAEADEGFLALSLPSDISYPNRLSAQLQFLTMNPHIDLVGGQVLVFGEDFVPMGKICAAQEHEVLTGGCGTRIKLFEGAWMGRLQWFQKHEYDAEIAELEDQDLLQRAATSSRYGAIAEMAVAHRSEMVESGRKTKISGAYGALALVRKLRGGLHKTAFGFQGHGMAIPGRQTLSSLSERELEEWLAMAQVASEQVTTAPQAQDVLEPSIA
jgi:hypothetical protein